MKPWRRAVPAVWAMCLVTACAGGDTSSPTDTVTSVGTDTSAAPGTEATTSTVSESPAASRTREVDFAGAGIDLVGTLRLPDADAAPGVVLMHGSGPQSRDAVAVGQLNMTFGFEIPIFAEIGAALQDAGFAVLTYDKRTCGAFNGCSANDYRAPGDDLLIDDFVADAEAAVAFLRSRPEVDPARISVVGHSQGAEFVTIMLAADPELSSGAMLGGPARPIDDLVEFQLTSSVELLESMGLSEDEALGSPGMAEFAGMLDGIRTIRDGGTDPVVGTSAAFWSSWFDLGAAKVAAVDDLQQPVLILNGELDWNVPPSEADIWAQHFTDAGKEHDVAVLECVSHALNCISEPAAGTMLPDEVGTTVAPQVSEVLIEFLSSAASR